ncbi:MAG: AAA family ATPase [Proteobacteria bacterium]|nr:AAA family ATPase [Pseudomonadota bacterium]MBU1739881.1 AAA family ATPase [Pseudomonadota bacterium]MBU1858211.1 AAA family ATPase [Verrucomicrobiota bacterium]
MTNKHKIADLLTELRPVRFSEIVGQEVIKKQITNTVAKDTVPNGIMFTGTWGSGKTTIATVLAHSLSCEGWKLGQYEPCGECESCLNRTYSVHHINSSMEVTDEKLKDKLCTVKYAQNMWGGRKAVLILDDLDNLPQKQQRMVRASLDERWPKGTLIVTIMDASKIDKPLRQRLLEMPVMPPLLPELVAWLKEGVLKRLNILIKDEKAVEELVRAGQLNFRSILKILSPIYDGNEPLTVATVRDAAMQNGYG